MDKAASRRPALRCAFVVKGISNAFAGSAYSEYRAVSFSCMAIACPPLLLRFNDDMTTLARRRSPDAPDDCWHVYYGDVLDWDDRDPIWQSN